MQGQNLAGGRELGGQPCGGFLKRLANDDGLWQRGERNARDEDARLRKYLDQTLVGQFQDGFANRRPAHAVGERDLGLRDRFAGPALQRYQFGAKIRIDPR